MPKITIYGLECERKGTRSGNSRRRKEISSICTPKIAPFFPIEPIGIPLFSSVIQIRNRGVFDRIRGYKENPRVISTLIFLSFLCRDQNYFTCSGARTRAHILSNGIPKLREGPCEKRRIAFKHFSRDERYAKLCILIFCHLEASVAAPRKFTSSATT